MLNTVHLFRTDLNLLVLFDVVLTERHVGRAAERLRLTPSAVSHGLGRLRRLFHDPLFLRTPKGVVPTARAIELAPPIADLLARARYIVGLGEPFDPATSVRRFTIGAPDGISSVVLPSLLASLAPVAPGIDISIRQVLPAFGESSPDRAWRLVFAELDEHAMDLAIIPTDAVPSRFESRALLREDFVIAVRAGNPFASDSSLQRYCEMGHVVVSQSGDPHGFVDSMLAERGLARRIALTVPNAMFALATVGATELVAALPRQFVALYGERFGVIALDYPLAPTAFVLNAVAPRVALMDAGLAWLYDLLGKTMETGPKRRGREPSRRVR
jgi:DNA-binding transcriptional LysR family regulator